MQAIAAGLTNKEIAAHLGLRETVKWYIAKMMRSAGVPNRAALVEVFHRDHNDRSQRN